MSNNQARLTPQEKKVVDTLGDAYNLFAALPKQHDWDAHEFTHAIHAAQNIVLSRPATRPKKPVKKKQIGKATEKYAPPPARPLAMLTLLWRNRIDKNLKPDNLERHEIMAIEARLVNNQLQLCIGSNVISLDLYGNVEWYRSICEKLTSQTQDVTNFELLTDE